MHHLPLTSSTWPATQPVVCLFSFIFQLVTPTYLIIHLVSFFFHLVTHLVTHSSSSLRKSLEHHLQIQIQIKKMKATEQQASDLQGSRYCNVVFSTPKVQSPLSTSHVSSCGTPQSFHCTFFLFFFHSHIASFFYSRSVLFHIPLQLREKQKTKNMKNLCNFFFWSLKKQRKKA